jgi:quaternary ammonium compound-resistance protein SugE
MAWIYLLTAGLLEIVWATALKYSDGFTRLWPSSLGLAAATVRFLLPALALKTLPVGTAYAIWVGIGVGGVAIFGMAVLGEPISVLRIGFLSLILVGVLGLKAVSG